MEKEKLDKMYDICFFDLDGTIIDSSPGITNSVMYALEKFGIEETEREKLYKFIGPPLTDSFARFYGFDDEKSWKAVEYYREYYQDTGIFECSVYPGFEKSLKALKAAGKRLLLRRPNRKYMREGSLNILTWINILNMWQVWNWTEAEAVRQR